ncbi:MAG: DNA translocase FtsK 4TM domain-containing protein [Bacteroidales bacterium]|nr:DNA translocase FtsK 4TM domain-containing protein [Bacteroidales bacterium]
MPNNYRINQQNIEPPKKVKKTSVKRERNHKSHRTLKLTFGITFITIAVYAALSMISFLINYFTGAHSTAIETLPWYKYLVSGSGNNFMGNFGDLLAHLLMVKWFGIGAFILVTILFNYGFFLTFDKKIIRKHYLLAADLFIVLWLSLMMAIIFKNPPLDILRGYVGAFLRDIILPITGTIGTIALLVIIMIVFVGLRYHFNILSLFKKREQNDSDDKDNQNADSDANTETPESPDPACTDLDGQNTEINQDDEDEDPEIFPEETETVDTEATPESEIEDPFAINDNDIKDNDEIIVERPEEVALADDEIKDHYTIDTEYDPTLDLRHYKMPTLDLLNDYESGSVPITDEEINRNREKIKNTLRTYGIEIQSIKATVGPTITLYEIIPAPGVRIAKIKSLEDDIALSLAAFGIRIIAPIPGKGTIGIEVPNSNPQIVSMKSVLSSKRFVECSYELPIALGKTISNESFVADLTKMPHLLVAGATGQGKSVGLNAIITSLLYKKHPAQLKFVMVDPKKVELSLYNKIEKHYLAKLPDIDEPIITETKYVVNTLNSLLIEMESRYSLIKLSGVRNIKEYNSRFVARKLNPENGHRFLPYIVVVIDEFADLIMTAGKEIETPLTRLAQLARATGIHLIIATQRPSVNIITGTIKANFPARLAFRVVQKVDSRTILDTGGADQLVGRGDMLLSTGSDLIRMQCAFVDTDEVMAITNFIGDQQGYESAYELPEYSGDNQDNGSTTINNVADRDELFNQAAHLIVGNQHGSTSLLQRKLNLGYNRAGRIMDQLEAAGIVGPADGSKPREVYVFDETELDKILNM